MYLDQGSNSIKIKLLKPMLYYFLIIKKGDYFMPIQSTNILKSLSNEELLSQTKNLVQKERHLNIQVIGHLSEIEYRKLYLKRGFSSLFDYTVKELGYSEGSAYRRIKAMKLCREIPETTSKLKTGNLNLTTVSQLQTFFEKQDKKAKKKQVDLNLQNTQKQKVQSNLSVRRSDSSPRRIDASYLENKTQKLDLLKKVEGKSRRQTEKLLCEIDPDLSIAKEKLRFIGNGKMELKIIMDEDLRKKLEELKNLFSHRNSNISYGELFSILVKLGLNKYDPRRKLKKKQLEKFNKKIQIKINDPSKTKNMTGSEKLIYSDKSNGILKNFKQISNRYIPAEVKRSIWMRDEGKCSYFCPETEKKCGSKHLLQIDHIHPYSLGGGSEPGNLRLLCAGHNQYRNKNL